MFWYSFACLEYAMSEYFRFGFIPSPLSIYSSVYQLSPGHCLKFTSSHEDPSLRPWWPLEQKSADAFSEQFNALTNPESFILDHLNHTLESVIAQQSLSDVPLGTFLSEVSILHSLQHYFSLVVVVQYKVSLLRFPIKVQKLVSTKHLLQLQSLNI